MFDSDKIETNCYLCGRYFYHYTQPWNKIPIKCDELYCQVCQLHKFRCEEGSLVVELKKEV